MYYKECGSKEGQLVIFIHGGFTTHESFMKQYDLLPNKRMIFVDLPGFGNKIKNVMYEKELFGNVYVICKKKHGTNLI